MLPEPSPTGVLWASRGRAWGFRFLLRGTLTDPLFEYERFFVGRDHEEALIVLEANEVAFRFPDPESRRDASGRVIPHEFVVGGDLALRIRTLDDALVIVWPIVAATYAEVWDQPKPPEGDVSLIGG